MVLKLPVVARTLGGLLLFLGVALLMPALVGWIYAEPSAWGFVWASGIAFALGGGSWAVLGTPGREDVGAREGFAIVGLSWITLSLIGALPFVFGGVLPSFTDAFFETMSGFTTTGATILGGAATPGIEAIPRAFHFWRSLAHWMGGMGIIVLTLAVLPILGVGGMQLFRAEVPGPSADKLTPRVRETAKRLWMLYVGITAIEVLALLPAMSLFDAVNHAFATMATGGFSPEGGSVGDYNSAYVDGVITVFMFLAGMNFALHYRMIRGEPLTAAYDSEFRVYAGIVGVATVALMLATWQPAVALLPGELVVEAYSSLATAFRYASFQVVAIVTTTGFGTADYELWAPVATGILFLLFFCGGMAGSTGGGVKVVRHMLLGKSVYKEIRQLVHPQAVLPIRLNDEVVSRNVIDNILAFLVLYLGLLFFGTIVVSALGLDLWSAFTAALSCVGNIGPAFGSVGPTDNYAHIPALGKWVLSFLMVAGRLEIYTVLILLAPAFWRQ